MPDSRPERRPRYIVPAHRQLAHRVTYLEDRIEALERELREIAAEFKELPPEEPIEGAESLHACFEVSNGNLFDALLELCRIARENNRPITFM